MVRMMSLMIMLFALGACASTRDYDLPETGSAVEHKPLVVPHRDWIADHCYPHREQQQDGRWIMRKRCEIK